MPALLHALVILANLYAHVSPPVYAAALPPQSPAIGSDISYPQCGKSYPTQSTFAIIGVNGGRANTTNPCLASQLAWASHTPGTPTQPNLQLYVNTGNPRQETTLTWPQNNIDLLDNRTNNPYGNCDGANTTACAWQYGWNRAMEDIINRFLPAAQIAQINTNPATYRWWLDVETANSWQDGSAAALANNVAVLEGLVSHFQAIGATVGLYSTPFQWSQITGDTLNPSSNLNYLPTWLPGAQNLTQAQASCHHSPLTPTSHLTLTQYTDQFDHNYPCP